MTAAAVRDFAAHAAAQRNEVFGEDFLFRGETVRCSKSAGTPSLDLGEGGLRTSASLRIRVPASITPPPIAADANTRQAPEEFVEVLTGRRFYVVGCIPAGGSALAAEHIVELELA